MQNLKLPNPSNQDREGENKMFQRGDNFWSEH